jgi:hypothetical protein
MFPHLEDISQSFKLCCTCFPYFCGAVGSESKEEMVWPAIVWNMLLGVRTSVVWSLILRFWCGWWLRSVIHDIVVLNGVTSDASMRFLWFLSTQHPCRSLEMFFCGIDRSLLVRVNSY